MVESITIRGMRGIREGTVEDFGRLTVMTGVNGCGKSTVLDALLITHSAEPLAALDEVARRRPHTPEPLRWLIHEAVSDCQLIVTDDTETRSYSARRAPDQGRDTTLRLSAGLGASSDELQFLGWISEQDSRRESSGPEIDTIARLFDPSIPMPVVEAYSEVIRSGRRSDITDVLSRLVPGFEALEILAEPGGRSFLYITRSGQGAVPVSVSGDGIQALVQTAVTLATLSDGLALIEEPEVFQHPGSLRQTARVLWANVRRGVQVVLTTHSLDLIDALVQTAGPDDLPQLVVLTLAMDDGTLRCSRVAGDEVRFARATMESDLR